MTQKTPGRGPAPATGASRPADGSRSRRRRGGTRGRGRRSNQRHHPLSRLKLPKVTTSQLTTLFALIWYRLKHRLHAIAGLGPTLMHRSRRREHVYVDASFADGQGTEAEGNCGIGVWLPRRSVAIALRVKATTSMEGEILALLAGAMVAKHFKVERPVIFSDCKSAVRTATHFMQLGRIKGLGQWLARLMELSSSHHAYGPIYDALHRLGGTLEWRPREDNREADLASCIGSRIGHMGILLAGAKDRSFTLNDVLSIGTSPTGSLGEEDRSGGLVQRRLRCGTLAVSLPTRDASADSRAFIREAGELIEELSAGVA